MPKGFKGFQKGNEFYKITNQKHFSGYKSSNWKGGVTVCKNGYIFIFTKEHPFKNSNGYVKEHRLVVEKQIGRYLKRKEPVHHIDGIKSNNDHKNLMAFVSQSAHNRFHINPNNVKAEEIIFDGRKI